MNPEPPESGPPRAMRLWRYWPLGVVLLLLALSATLLERRRPGTLTDGGPAARGEPAALATLERDIGAVAREWVAAGKLARPDDGFIYAVDVGQLMIWSAQARDRDLYTRLRAFAVERLIRDDPADPMARGMVGWRVKPPERADASGTTESLRVAQGLWLGAAAFDAPADRELALTILHGYARHQATEQGVWLIRNYYAFETRAFAPNSFLIDYDADFVGEVAAATGDAELRDVAQQSAALVRSAVSPAGLTYDLIQPELATLLPRQAVIFSPNDMVQVSNTAAVAEHSLRDSPAIGRGILRFALARQDRLNLFYYGRTGAEATPRPIGAETWAVLYRLAAKLRDDAGQRAFLPHVVVEAQRFYRHPPEPKLYLASELLLALRAAQPAPIAAPQAADPPADLQPRLHERVRQWVQAGQLARPDGYTYASDVGPLLHYAARAGDRALYAPLRDFAAAHLIADSPSAPYCQGFVAWRYRPGAPPERSDAGDALRLAEGLWAGAQAFGNPADRALALLVLRGYARHEAVDQHVWFVRHYFNFAAKSFVMSSYLIDYDPDLLAAVAAACPATAPASAPAPAPGVAPAATSGGAGDAQLRAVAEQSRALVKKSVAPCGLIYELVQPEVATIMPGNAASFSPNDVVGLRHAAIVAERCAIGAPEVARGVLQFALDHRYRPSAYYLGRTGEATLDDPADAATFAVLVRLALKLHDRPAAAAFIPALLEHAQELVINPAEPRLGFAGEMLLTLEAMRRDGAR